MKQLIQKLKRDILDFSQYATYPPTDKQAWYCAKLLAERGCSTVDTMFDTTTVTGKDVSQLIDLLLNNPEMFKKAA